MLEFLQRIKELGVNVSMFPLCFLVPQENVQMLLKQLIENVSEAEDVTVNLREGEAELELHLYYQMHFTVKLFLAPGAVEIQEEIARVELIQQKPPEIRGRNLVATKFLQNAFNISRSLIYRKISEKAGDLQVDDQRIRFEMPLRERVSEKVLNVLRFVTVEKFAFEEHKVRLYLKIFPAA